MEHFPKEKASAFINECFRVLKPGGILRVVVPDLENIVNEYKRFLELCKTQNDNVSHANYDWIMLEMYDQTVRNYSGGHMAEYLKQTVLHDEKYILDRIGFIGRSIRDQFLQTKATTDEVRSTKSSFSRVLEINDKLKNLAKPQNLRKRLLNKILSKEEKQMLEVGRFRLGGEVHYWMYDRFSLSELLKDCGFENINILDPFTSEISDWSKYELDVKDGLAFDPTSLFVEATKP